MAGVATSRAGRTIFSAEALIAFRPEAAYRMCMMDAGAGAGPLLCRLGNVILVIGVAVPIMAVQRVTVGLFLATALSWSFVLAIQVAMGALVIASAPARSIRFWPALDLWFAGHLPYSMWLLVLAAVLASLPAGSVDMLIALAVIPAAWTAAIVSAFCRVVLGTSRTGGRWRASAHFVAVWAIGLQYVAWSTGGWFRVTGSIMGLFA
jgi:hypothetical protein